MSYVIVYAYSYVRCFVCVRVDIIMYVKDNFTVYNNIDVKIMVRFHIIRQSQREIDV